MHDTSAINIGHVQITQQKDVDNYFTQRGKTQEWKSKTRKKRIKWIRTGDAQMDHIDSSKQLGKHKTSITAIQTSYTKHNLKIIQN